MKRLLLLLVCVLLINCSPDDGDFEDFRYEILPILSVEMPESFTFGQYYDIPYTYEVPSTCHFFNELYYVADANTRTVAVINTVFEENQQNQCESLTDSVMERSFRFIVTIREGTYIFKFWQGVDNNGDDIYDTYEVPVEL